MRASRKEGISLLVQQSNVNKQVSLEIEDVIGIQDRQKFHVELSAHYWEFAL